MTTRKRHTPEQVVRKLTQADRLLGEGKEVADVCRELQVSEQTYYRWRNQFGGLKADDAKKLKELERENATLKRLLADAQLEKAALEEIAQGNFRARDRAAPDQTAPPGPPPLGHPTAVADRDHHLDRTDLPPTTPTSPPRPIDPHGVRDHHGHHRGACRLTTTVTYMCSSPHHPAVRVPRSGSLLGRRIGRRTATIASVVRWVRPSRQHQNQAHCCAGRMQCPTVVECLTCAATSMAARLVQGCHLRSLAGGG